MDLEHCRIDMKEQINGQNIEIGKCHKLQAENDRLRETMYFEALSLSLSNDHEVHYILTDFHQFHGTAKRERAKRSNTLHVVSWLKGSYKF